MIDIAVVAAQLALLVAVAPLVSGVLRRTKARFQARRGPPLVQLDGISEPKRARG